MRIRENSSNLTTQTAGLAPLVDMNRLITTLVLIGAATSAAAEDRMALDYRAADPTCIDGARFADEVSAKLGYVPWDERAFATLQVHIGREGAMFVGAFRNVDGGTKLVQGQTCFEVTSLLAVAVATTIDPSSIRARPPGEATPGPAVEDTVAVTFAGENGRRVDISVWTGHSISRQVLEVGDLGSVTAFYKDLCTSPCTAHRPRGRSHFSLFDPQTRASGHVSLLLDHPTSITIRHHSRAGARRATFAVGVLLTGASIVTSVLVGRAHGTHWGMLTGTSTGIGVGTMAGSRWIEDYLTTHSP